MDGWMDLLSGTGVATALRNAQWPRPSHVGHIGKSFKSKDSAKYITYYVVFFILMFPLVFVALTSKNNPRVEILGQFDLGKSSRKGHLLPYK